MFVAAKIIHAHEIHTAQLRVADIGYSRSRVPYSLGVQRLRSLHWFPFLLIPASYRALQALQRVRRSDVFIKA